MILPVYAVTGNPILSYNVVFLVDVRAVGDRHVPVRARPDRIERRGVSRRPGLRLCAVPLRHAAARAGVVVDVDAVRAARLSPFSREPPRRAARRRGRRHGSRRTCRAATTCCSSVRRSRSTSRSRSRGGGCGRTRRVVGGRGAGCRRRRRSRPRRSSSRTGSCASLGFSPRSLAETIRYSADVLGYGTADVGMWLWGGMVRAWPKPEGSLFPGFAIRAAGGVRPRPSMAAGPRPSRRAPTTSDRSRC